MTPEICKFIPYLERMFTGAPWFKFSYYTTHYYSSHYRLLDKLKPYLVPNEIIDLFNEERSPNDDLFYSHKENYIRGKLGIQGVSKLYQNQRKTMIYLEELGHSLYLEEFDRTKIKLTHMKDRQFRFPITVNTAQIQNNQTSTKYDFEFEFRTN